MALRSCGVNSKWCSGLQLCSDFKISSLHSSMAFWDKQFQGFDEVIGWEGIIDRKIGEVTGEEFGEVEKERLGDAGSSAEGCLRAVAVQAS